MNHDEFKFKCEKCGKLFDPDPSMVTEAGIISSEDYEKHYTEGQEWQGEAPVKDGAIIICQPCVDELQKESEL